MGLMEFMGLMGLMGTSLGSVKASEERSIRVRVRAVPLFKQEEGACSFRFLSD